MKHMTRQEKDDLFKNPIKDYLSGNESIQAIANKYSLPYGVFYKYVADKGIVQYRKKRPPRRKNVGKIQQVIEEYKNDNFATIKGMAKKYHVCEPTICRWLKNAGIEPRKKYYLVDKLSLKRAVSYYNEGMNYKDAAKKARIGKNTLNKYLKENNLLRHSFKIQKDKTYDKNYFDSINTEHKAYWLGFIYADGCNRIDKENNSSSVTIEISSKDEKLLQKYLNDLNSNTQIKHRERKQKSGNISKVCSVRFCSIHMSETLAKYGCVPNKTYDGWIDKNMLNSHELKIAFLRGYFDGDGYISNNKNSVHSLSYVIHSYRIMNTILKMIIKETGCIPQVRFEGDERGGAYRLRITNKDDFFSFLSCLYKNATIYLERKYNRYKTAVLLQSRMKR